MSVKKIFESLHKINETEKEDFFYKIVDGQVITNTGETYSSISEFEEAGNKIELWREVTAEEFDKLCESANAYDYKGYVIIQTSSGWRIKNGAGEFVGNEYSTDKDAEEYIDSLNEDSGSSRPNEARLWSAVEYGELDARHVLDSLLSFLSDDVIGEFIKSEYEDLLESSKTNEQDLNEMPRLPHLTQKIIDELDKKAKLLAKRKYGADIVDYVSVTSGPAGVEFSAELEYEDMDEIADELNKILEKHGFHTYFEAEDSGFWTAYIDPQFIDESYEDEMAGNEEPEFMSTEAFVNWHDNEYMSPEFDFKLEKVYNIFNDNGLSDIDDVAECYDRLSDEDKIKVTEVIRKGGH